MSKKEDKCELCNRKHVEGCSHIDCPNRKPLTAQFDEWEIIPQSLDDTVLKDGK